jgi:hypothetical protein
MRIWVYCHVVDITYCLPAKLSVGMQREKDSSLNEREARLDKQNIYTLIILIKVKGIYI